jgi:hypothetical protein
MLAATLTLLTPRGLLLALLAVPAVAAVLAGRRRAETVRRALELPAAAGDPGTRRAVLVAAVAVLLALAAAQPALTRESDARVRRDVQALFVLDTSRSMAAAPGARAASRLDRATAAAARLRRAIPTVAAGIATLTDRVLPDLLPVADSTGFDAVLARAVAIESPPPRASAVRATSYDALQELAGSGYWDRHTSRRIVVVLTDGESTPLQSSELAGAFAEPPGLQVLFVRFWRAGERVYDADGRAEAGYLPDPSGQALLAELAQNLGGRAYEEGDVGAAAARLRSLAGRGPTTASGAVTRTRTALGPAAGLLALLAVAGLFWPAGDRPGRRTLTTR